MPSSQSNNYILTHRLSGELLGSFAIALFGCYGASVASNPDLGYGPYFGGFLSGATLSLCIYALNNLSGAHVNPAITLAFWLLGRISHNFVPIYILAQVTGSIIAGFVLNAFMGVEARLGLNTPSLDASHLEALAVEVYVSATMMLVILFSYKQRFEFLKPVFIGTVVMLNIWLFGAEFGASMNPIRALGPNLFFSGFWGVTWIYLLGPVIGCLLIASLYRPFYDK
jgi:aquaporin NIP